jgi:hypothetical protein
MKPYERTQLLERVDREGATVGAQIPAEITVQGERLALREFVFETRSRASMPAGERERVEEAKKNLRRERLARRQRLEEADISREEGEELTESIIGIDRALHALSDLGTTDVESEVSAQEMADRKRWLSFLKQALGRDNSGARR